MRMSEEIRKCAVPVLFRLAELTPTAIPSFLKTNWRNGSFVKFKNILKKLRKKMKIFSNGWILTTMVEYLPVCSVKQFPILIC